MADHAPLLTSENYATLLTSRISGRLDDISKNFDPAHTSGTNIPTNTIRWNSTLNRDEKWNGTSWVEKSTNYAINISGESANCTGNAGTVTNGVYTSVAYSNPSWITTLDGAKITGVLPSSAMTYLANGIGAIAQTVADWLSDEVRVTSWMSLAQKIDARAGTKTLELSSVVQACIDANKGKKIVFPSGYTYWIQGVLLDGATYNNTHLVCDGLLMLKAAPTFASNNFQTVWSGLSFRGVDGCKFQGNFSGDRSSQQNREQTICMTVAGCTNFKVPYANFSEIRGDGMYISQLNLSSNSTNSRNIALGQIYGANSAAGDGRNLISHISGDNVTCDDFTSVDIGGTVNGAAMPGGWDTEPNFAYQTCDGVSIGRMYVRHAGTSGAAWGSATGSRSTRNVSVGSCTVVNTCAPTSNDGLGNMTVTINHTGVVLGVDGFTCMNYTGEFTNAYGDALIISDSTNVQWKGTLRHVREAARIGNDARDVSGSGVQKSDINLTVIDTCRYGIRTGRLTDCKISGMIYPPLTGFYSGSLHGVVAFSYPQINVTYSVNVTASANWTRSYRNEAGFPATFTNTKIANCDVSGASWSSITNQAGDMQVPRYNMIGVTNRAAVPAVGSNLWVFGQMFTNDTGTVGQPRGWTFSTGSTMVSWGNL